MVCRSTPSDPQHDDRRAGNGAACLVPDDPGHGGLRRRGSRENKSKHKNQKLFA